MFKLVVPMVVLAMAWTNGPGGLALGNPSWVIIVIYICAARAVTESVCRLFPLVHSQLVDEDHHLHNLEAWRLRSLELRHSSRNQEKASRPFLVGKY